MHRILVYQAPSSRVVSIQTRLVKKMAATTASALFSQGHLQPFYSKETSAAMSTKAIRVDLAHVKALSFVQLNDGAFVGIMSTSKSSLFSPPVCLST